MVSWGRKLAYFALGSAAVGTIFGLGFAVNLGGRPIHLISKIYPVPDLSPAAESNDCVRPWTQRKLE